MTVKSKLEIAQEAALLFHPDVIDVRFVKTHKTGEDEFTASRQNKIGQITITLNPNGTKAAIEWKGRLSPRDTAYRVFRIEGFPTTDETPMATAES
jgi:hypothetical protein